MICLLVVLAILAGPGGPGRAQGGSPPVVSATVHWQHAPGGGFLNLSVSIPPGIHINADAAQLKATDGFTPVATRIAIEALPPEVTSAEPEFPPAHAVTVSFSQQPLMVFEGQIAVRIPLTGEGLKGETIPATRLVLTYQACDERTCFFPDRLTLTTGSIDAATPAPTAPGVGEGPSARPIGPVVFSLFGRGLSLDATDWIGRILLMVMAALGGVLLNLTPCVLPLIPIKIISLSAAAEKNPRRCLLLGMAMTAGIIAFWAVLGMLVITISALTAANQLFQYPWFTVTVGLVIAVMAAGMLRPAAVTLPGWVYLINPSQDRLPGSFLLGILAAVLSTPCTAPFMGAAVAWAVTQPPVRAFAVFIAVGMGMALPYAVLAARPGLARRLPKTGPANQLLKEVMGWLMLAAAAYFVGTGVSGLMTVAPVPPGRRYWWVVMGFCALAGLWFAHRYRPMAATRLKQRMGVALGLTAALASVGMGWLLADMGEIRWVYYTPASYAEAMARQKPVVLVFTAEWCLNCKAIEHQVYRDPEVVRLFAVGEAIPVKIDLTAPNPDGRAFLQSTGRLTIPLVIVRAPDGRNTLVADFYTAEELIEAIRKGK
ncbi:MAG: cytochrome c biogenesis protein CcdA [Pseudomonadota bacterium]